jgi:hypothetical protein
MGIPSGVFPPALLDLTGLEKIAIGGRSGGGLTGTIPAALGKLQQLRILSLWSNNFHGTIPHELTALQKLVQIYFGGNQAGIQLTGVLPAFNFSQFTGACVMSAIGFKCPLPAGADTCVGYAGHTFPPPSCK